MLGLMLLASGLGADIKNPATNRVTQGTIPWVTSGGTSVTAYQSTTFTVKDTGTYKAVSVTVVNLTTAYAMNVTQAAGQDGKCG